MEQQFNREELIKLIDSGLSKSKICIHLFGNNGGKTYKRLDKLLLSLDISPSEIEYARGNNKYSRILSIYDLALMSLVETPFSHNQYKKLCLTFNNMICNNCFSKRLFTDNFHIEIHHIDGNKKNNRIENLIPLCANCHKEDHLHQRKNQVHLEEVEKYVIRMRNLIENSTPKFENKILNFTKPNELLFLIKTAEMLDYDSFTEERLMRFEKAYNQAKKEKKFQFDFEKKVVITDYAKTLIKHLKKINKNE